MQYPNPRLPLAHKIKDAAALLGCSISTVRRLIDRGVIRPNRYMRHVVITDDELNRFIRRND